MSSVSSSSNVSSINTLCSDRVGEVSYTKYGTPAVIKEYINYGKVLVQFQDKYKYEYWTSYGNFKKGMLTNPYEPRVKNGIGFIGVGKYNSKEHKLAYHKWKGMLQRCTNPMDCKNTESYYDCEVCEAWYNFQNFAEWFYDSLYPCDETVCVDKDILVHGNKLYSPETCLLVPERINLLFVKEYKRRGSLPIGVQKCKGDKYISVVSTYPSYIYLGVFDSIEETFATYKRVKENYIREVAESYKSILPQHVYEAIINYRIEMTD